MTLSQKVTRMRFGFFVLLGAVLFASPQAKGQDFNYTLQVNTTNWSELSSQTLCNSVNQPWQSSYRIATGFSFPFNGGSYDSVTIETNGYLVFDRNRDQAFAAFTTFYNVIDTSGNNSVLGYEVSGTAGNKILKIQYLHVGLNNYSTEQLSYQLWLHENGQIEVIVGENSFQSSNSASPFLLGVLDMNMMAENRGYLVGYTSGNYIGQPVNNQTPEPLQIGTLPQSGTKFLFIPVGSN